MKKSYEIDIQVKTDVKSVSEGAQTVERELTATQKRLQKLTEWVENNGKAIERAMKAMEAFDRIGGFFTGFEKMMSGINSQVGKLKSSFDALKNSIEAAANAKRKFGDSFGTGGGGGSGGAKIIPVDNSRTGGGTSGVWKSEQQAILKASNLAVKYENQLAKLKGSDSEVAKLNRTLGQPGVASRINETTKALLREKAAAVDVEREMQKAAKTAERQSSRSFGDTAVGSFLGNLGANAISGITGKLTAGAAAVLDYSSKLEQARIGFTSLTGSADAAAKHLADLQNFAKVTPFDFDELAKGSQLLQGVGIKAEKIIPISPTSVTRSPPPGKAMKKFSGRF